MEEERLERISNLKADENARIFWLIDSMYVRSPLRTACLRPCIYDCKPVIIPLWKRISRISIRIAKILLFINIAIILITGGTLLIEKFCPVIYHIWLLFILGAGYVSAEFIFD